MTRNLWFRVRRYCRCAFHALLPAIVKMGSIILPIILVSVFMPVSWFLISYYGPDLVWDFIGGGMITFFALVGLHHAVRVQLADQHSILSCRLLLVKTRLNRLKKDPDPFLLEDIRTAPLTMSQSMLDYDLDDASAQVSWEQTLGYHSLDDEPAEDDQDLSESLQLIDGCIVDITTDEIVSFPADENAETPQLDLPLSDPKNHKPIAVVLIP